VVNDDGDAEVGDVLRSRLIVVLRSMVGERCMEAIMDALCGERHASSLYTAHGLHIFLQMIMIKITWPPTCTGKCLCLIGSVILPALVIVDGH
jgi:hypothetical protein